MSTTTISKPKTTNNLIQVRVPADLKERTAKIFAKLGTDTSEAIRMFLVQVDETKSIPFKIRTGAYPISAAERIEEVAATFALEDIPLSRDDIQELKDIELAKTSTTEMRKKTIAELKRKYGD